MKLKDLITKLQGKPDKEEDVQFVVFKSDGGSFVCIELKGEATEDIVKVLGKHYKKAKK